MNRRVAAGPERPSERAAGPERPSERAAGPERPSERAALLVPPGDPVALAEALDRALHDTATARALVAAGEARALEFSMDRLAERYVELYVEARERAGVV